MIVNAKVKATFFDSKAVKDPTERGLRNVLAKFGAYVRTRAMSSLRSVKGPASPGSPPHTHGRKLLKNSIFFMYEPNARNVVIGPTPLADSPVSDGIGAEALEYSGGVNVILKNKAGRYIRTKKRIFIAARPFMHPAFDYVKDRELPDMWRDSIRKD